MKNLILIALIVQTSISFAFILPAPKPKPPKFTIYNAVTILMADRYQNIKGDQFIALKIKNHTPKKQEAVTINLYESEFNYENSYKDYSKLIDIDAYNEVIVVIPIYESSNDKEIWAELNLFEGVNSFYPKKFKIFDDSQSLDLTLDISIKGSFNSDIVRYFGENEISLSNENERVFEFENDVPRCEYKMLTADLLTFSYPMQGVEFWIADHLMDFIIDHNNRGGSGQATGLVWYDGHWRMSNGSVRCE